MPPGTRSPEVAPVERDEMIGNIQLRLHENESWNTNELHYFSFRTECFGFFIFCFEDEGLKKLALCPFEVIKNKESEIKQKIG